jgi:flagellar biosynthesis protein FlhG
MHLGAGTSFNTLDFFFSVTRASLTLLPEPPSIENAIPIHQSIYFRYLSHCDYLKEISASSQWPWTQKPDGNQIRFSDLFK